MPLKMKNVCNFAFKMTNHAHKPANKAEQTTKIDTFW